MSVPDNLKDVIAAQLSSVTGLPGFGGFPPFPFVQEQAIIVNRTLDRREELAWSHSYGNVDGRPNLYTAVLVCAKFRPGVDLSAAEQLREDSLAAIRAYLQTNAGKRLNDGTQDLCQSAGVPLEVRNDVQGPVIAYMKDAYVGAYITMGVLEHIVTVTN